MNSVNATRDSNNGLGLIINTNPNSESIAISLMIRVGSIYETPNIRGGTHLIEHLMFKGTSEIPDKLKLAQTLDSMGAVYNAYTDYMLTCYHLKVERKHFTKALNLLCQMVKDSLFRKEDFINEKPVVIEELLKERDNPANYVHQLFYEIMFHGTVYSKSIGADPPDIKQIPYEMLKEYWKNNYSLQNIVISVSGKVGLDDVVNVLETNNFLKLGNRGSKNQKIVQAIPQTNPRCKVERRDKMKQIQLMVGFPCFGSLNPDRFALQLLKIILAGNMSSRLFIKLRDTYGLAYSVVANFTLFNNLGEFSVSSGVDDTNICSMKTSTKGEKADALSIILAEFYNLSKKGVTDKEVMIAKDYLKGGLILDFENNQTISDYYGRLFLLDEPLLSVKAYIDRIDSVQTSDIQKICKELFVADKINVALIGNIASETVSEYLQKLVEIWKNNETKGNETILPSLENEYQKANSWNPFHLF